MTFAAAVGAAPRSTVTHRGERCGCVGGCAFFGSNLNGPTFFKPQEEDFESGYNVAVFR